MGSLREILAMLLMAGAFLSMVGVAAAILAMMRHREPDRSLMWYAVNGHAFFTGKGFRPEAAPLRRWLFRCYAAFFACVLAAMLVSFIGG